MQACARAYLCAAVEFCWQKEKKDSEQKIHKKVRKPNVSSQLERIKLMTEVKNKKSWCKSNGLTVAMNKVGKQKKRAQQERMKEGEEKLGGPFRGMCPWRFKTLTYRSCGKRRRRGFSTTLLHVSVISHFWVKRASLAFLLLRQEIYKWTRWQIEQ